MIKVKRALAAVIDLAMPRHSLISGQPMDEAEAQMWQSLHFLDEPCCDACGFPFDYALGDGVLCAACEVRRPRFGRMRAAIEYTEQSRKIVLDFKYGGRTDGLEFFTAQMMRAGRGVLADSDMLIPVPLHKARLRARRFNQSAILASALAGQTGLAFETNILLRKKNTESQGGKSAVARRRNVRAAFDINKNTAHRIKGRRAILIDDVYTTGATLNACAQALIKAGAARIDALCLMRVVKPAIIPK